MCTEHLMSCPYEFGLQAFDALVEPFYKKQAVIEAMPCTGYLAHPFAKIAIFAFSSLFAWCMKLERGKSKDVLLALPEKKPQAYEKNRCLLGEYV